MRPLVVNAPWPHRRSPGTAHRLRHVPAWKVVVVAVGVGVVFGPFAASLGEAGGATWTPSASSAVERLVRLAHPALSQAAAVCVAAELRSGGFTAQQAADALSAGSSGADAAAVRDAIGGCRTTPGQR